MRRQRKQTYPPLTKSEQQKLTSCASMPTSVSRAKKKRTKLQMTRARTPRQQHCKYRTQTSVNLLSTSTLRRRVRSLRNETWLHTRSNKRSTSEGPKIQTVLCRSGNASLQTTTLT